jgi:hypothetical protein
MNNRGVEDNIISQNIIQTGGVLRVKYFVPCGYGIFDHSKTSKGIWILFLGMNRGEYYNF